MIDRPYLPPASPLRLAAHHAHVPSKTSEPGLCALEDYTCLTGESFAMRSLRAQLRRVSPHFRVALISGEPGTCKETVALALHRLRTESDASFHSETVASLLAILPSTPAAVLGEDPLLGEFHPVQQGSLNDVSEAFGLKGARSTLFLTGAGDLKRGDQHRLLKLLQQIAEIKESQERPRIIFATRRDLRSLAGAGHFNRDLYRAISAVEIVLPPLRSRPEDIPLVTCSLLARSARSGGMSAGAFDGQALSRLQCHNWPGNLRELERVVDFARHDAGDAADGVIDAGHLPVLGEFAATDRQPRTEIRVERLEDVIHGHVLDVLMRCSGNKVRAAERLGISRSTLYRMLEASAPDAELERTA